MTNTAGLTIRRVRAVVTGGAGFIGSHVAEALLARGDEVHVLDDFSHGKPSNIPDGARVHEGDIRRDANAIFDDVEPELCFHLAAQADVRVSVERPDHDADVNVLGTIQVLDTARRHGTKIVFSSTGGAIYGECDGPAGEDHALLPLAPYGTSKLAGEQYLATYNRLYGTSHVSLRYGNVYGPRQDPHGEAGVVAIFMNLLMEDGTPKIFGDGKQTRDYVYVGDVVAATLGAAEHSGGVFNIGTGRETSVLDLYARIQRASGRAARAGVRGAAGGRVTTKRPRSVVGEARARLGAEAVARRRAGRDVGLVHLRLDLSETRTGPRRAAVQSMRRASDSRVSRSRLCAKRHRTMTGVSTEPAPSRTDCPMNQGSDPRFIDD